MFSMFNNKQDVVSLVYLSNKNSKEFYTEYLLRLSTVKSYRTVDVVMRNYRVYF